MNGKRVTAAGLQGMKERGERITMLTAYDYVTARLLDQAGIDIALIGDSRGRVVLGYENTLPVTMEDMLLHTKAVSRGVDRALVVADLPFMSYQVSIQQAVENAGRFVQEAGAHAVKLEGGGVMAETVSRLVDIGIPVMGHIGMTPQSVRRFGGFRVQGRTESDAERIINDAKALEEAGVFSMVLELIPQDVAKRVTETVSVPTIGIGAGPYCDGQVQVVNDILGLGIGRMPKHSKQYASFAETMSQAFEAYAEDVREGVFPGSEHSF